MQRGKLVIEVSQFSAEDALIVTALLFQSLDTQDQPVQNIGALAARLDQVVSS